MSTAYYRAMLISYQTDRDIQEEIIQQLGIRDNAQLQYEALCAERKKRREVGTWDPFGTKAGQVGVGGRAIA
jgi:hypothetical protein